jgi:hypothetical protein
MTGLVARWRDALAAAKGVSVGEERDLVYMTPAPHGGWRVALGSHIATVPDLVGIRYIARLVAVPNQEVPALALVVDKGTPLPETGGYAVLDATTVAALRQRIRDLRQQPVLSAGEQEELEALTHELTRALGLGGRSRAFADVPERARTAVRKAIKRAIGQISAANSLVGQHLAERIETGSVCRYCVEGHGSD